MIRIALSVLSGAALLSLSVASFAFSGKQLLELCEAKDNLCFGFILGVQEAETSHKPGRMPWMCVPTGVSAGAMGEVVTGYLQSNAQALGQSAVSLVSNALLTRWECSEAERLTHLQGVLLSLGLYRGALSGTLDDGTKAAIRQLQRNRGMPQTGEYTQFIHSQAIAFYRLNEASIWIHRMQREGKSPGGTDQRKSH